MDYLGAFDSSSFPPLLLFVRKKVKMERKEESEMKLRQYFASQLLPESELMLRNLKFAIKISFRD